MKRTLLVVVLGVVALVGGVTTGQILNHQDSEHPAVTYEPDFSLGDPFPDLEVVDDSRRATTTQTLLRNKGAVVLFVDPECPPCTDVVAGWQRHIDEGHIDRSDIMGIAMRDPTSVSRYREENQLTFPIYVDQQGQFQKRYGVKFLPLEIVVGISGKINRIDQGAQTPIDIERTYELIVQ